MDENFVAFMAKAGIHPEAFPIYYAFDSAPFLLNGQPSGAVGAVARLSRSLPNPPHIVLGIRISNVYTLPSGANADAVATYRACKESVDGEQTVLMNLAQQNITAELTLQKHITGGGLQEYFMPFPSTYPMAGGNDITLEIRRLTTYPQIAGADVLPTCFATLVCTVLRMGAGYGATQPVIRRHP